MRHRGLGSDIIEIERIEASIHRYEANFWIASSLTLNRPIVYAIAIQPVISPAVLQRKKRSSKH